MHGIGGRGGVGGGGMCELGKGTFEIGRRRGNGGLSKSKALGCYGL